jgi:hypothetical protein
MIVATPNPTVPPFFEPSLVARSTSNRGPNVTFSELPTTPNSTIAPSLTILEGIPPAAVWTATYVPPPHSAVPTRTILRSSTPSISPSRPTTPAVPTRHHSPTPVQVNISDGQEVLLTPDRRRSASVTSITVDDDAVSSALSSDNEDDPTSGPKIPKPPGEPGRPGSGGYNLAQTMDWNPRKFALMRVSFPAMS